MPIVLGSKPGGSGGGGAPSGPAGGDLAGTYPDPTFAAGSVDNTALGDVGAWTAFTPTLGAATTPPTLGSGSTAHGRYCRIGDVVVFWSQIIFGTSGAAAGTGDYTISFPVDISASHLGPVGYLNVRDPSGATSRSGWLLRRNATTCWLLQDATTAFIGPASPWAWGVNDTLQFFGQYEAA